MGDAPATVRAAMLAQAGAAWFRAERLEKAYATQTAALKLAPHDSEILIDRATTLGAAETTEKQSTTLIGSLKPTQIGPMH